MTTPAALLELHRRVAELLPWADRAVSGAVGVAAVVLALATWPTAVAVIGAVAVATVASRMATGVHRRAAARRTGSDATVGTPSVGVG